MTNRAKIEADGREICRHRWTIRSNFINPVKLLTEKHWITSLHTNKEIHFRDHFAFSITTYITHYPVTSSPSTKTKHASQASSPHVHFPTSHTLQIHNRSYSHPPTPGLQSRDHLIQIARSDQLLRLKRGRLLAY